MFWPEACGCFWVNRRSRYMIRELRRARIAGSPDQGYVYTRSPKSTIALMWRPAARHRSDDREMRAGNWLARDGMQLEPQDAGLDLLSAARRRKWRPSRSAAAARHRLEPVAEENRQSRLADLTSCGPSAMWARCICC